jgi:hypothetical protein
MADTPTPIPANNKGYTVTPEVPEAPSLLEKFISSTKKGLDSAADSTVNLLNAVGRPAELVSGFIVGNTVDLAGMPIDLMNASVVRPIQKLFGADPQTKAPSDHLRNLIGLPDSENDTPANIAGSLFSPAGASKAMIVAAARVVKTSELTKAAELFNAGVNNASVFNLTGAYKDSDNILKSIISDSGAVLKKEGWVTDGFGRSVPKAGAVASDIVQHEELFKLYPSLKSIPVNVERAPGVRGSLGDLGMTIKSFSPSEVEATLATLMHEFQHAIQKKEGFTKGSNTGNFLPKDIAARTEALREEIKVKMSSADPAIRKEAVDLKNAHNDMLKEAHMKYENVAGEQEARFTELTRAFSIEELGTRMLNLLRGKQTPQSFDTQVVPKASKK